MLTKCHRNVTTGPQNLQPKLRVPLPSSPFWWYASDQYIGGVFFFSQHQELREKFIKLEFINTILLSPYSTKRHSKTAFGQE